MKTKRFIALFLAFAMMAMAGSIAATATGNTPNGDLSYEDGGKIYVQDAKVYALEQQKLNEAQQLRQQLQLSRAYFIKVLNVPCFQQETSYWCGPATVKQVEHYLKNRSDTQASYAKALGTTTAGTDMTAIATYLNSNVNRWYTYSSIGSRTTWEDMIIWGMQNNLPAVLDIKTTNVNNIPYNSEGHFVNTSGIDYISASHWDNWVRITDPFGVALGNRWYTAADLYSANNAHWRKAMIW